MSPATQTSTLVRPAVEAVTDVQPLERVVVHVRVPPYTTEFIRIWQSTFLFDRASSHTSQLVAFERISLYPHWTRLDYAQPYVFTLVFEGLPKHVRSFDLAEVIPDPNGFRIEAIARRPGDVYEVDLGF
jgi:hypothetical protein